MVEKERLGDSQIFGDLHIFVKLFDAADGCYVNTDKRLLGNLEYFHSMNKTDFFVPHFSLRNFLPDSN